LSPHDDVLDTHYAKPRFSAAERYATQHVLYYQVLNAWILQSYRILVEHDRKVKLVIFDLDNTLWRGVASDKRIGSFEGRISGLIETIHILKKRGILVALVSKNDEPFIRENWHAILSSWAEEPLLGRLSLDDFVLVKINFEPKSRNVREIIDAVGVLPDSVVFVDDNPLEREDVMRNNPGIRVLGADMNSVRRVLLYSSAMQAATMTDEDAHRAETVKARLAATDAQAGQTTVLLEDLGLELRIGTATPETDRLVLDRLEQLINKTNQWTMNGARITPAEFQEALMHRTVVYGELNTNHAKFGIIVVAILDQDTLTHFVMSCRVMGFHVEDAFAAWLVKTFGPVRLRYVSTGRNKAFERFVVSLNGSAQEEFSLPSAINAPPFVRVTEVHLASDDLV
jgi:FkbH-like protein